MDPRVLAAIQIKRSCVNTEIFTKWDLRQPLRMWA